MESIIFNSDSSLISKNIIEITRELNKKSPIYFYTIYTTMTSPISNYMCCP